MKVKSFHLLVCLLEIIGCFLSIKYRYYFERFVFVVDFRNFFSKEGGRGVRRLFDFARGVRGLFLEILNINISLNLQGGLRSGPPPPDLRMVFTGLLKVRSIKTDPRQWLT